MRSKTLGRALGIGVRVAGKALLDGKPPLSASAQAAEQSRLAAERARAVQAAGDRGRSTGTRAGRATRNVGRGTGYFARALWNPFAHATGVLWLEITGLFFALFGVFFGQHVYLQRAAWRSGPQHGRFLLYAALTLLFVYFSLSSFLRARRKQHAGR